MNSVESILKEISEIKTSSYLIIRTEILEHEFTFLKVRLYLKDQLFMQVYRNDQYNTTNFVLIFCDERIYARDQVRGKWHRHPEDKSHTHDLTTQGKRPVNLRIFFEEVKKIIHKMNLI